MPHRKPLLKIIIGTLGALLLIAVILGVNLLLDIRRGGCESAGQLLGPASADGHIVSLPTQPGACFVSFVAVEGRDIKISRVVCSRAATLASCHELRDEVASNWSDLFGTRCASISFIGRAECDCTQTGAGCQKGAWSVELMP